MEFDVTLGTKKFFTFFGTMELQNPKAILLVRPLGRRWSGRSNSFVNSFSVNYFIENKYSVFQKIIEIISCAKPLTEEAEKGDKEIVLNQELPHSP